MSLASAFFQHYVEYLLSPENILTLCLLIAPLCYGFYSSAKTAGSRRPIGLVPGCRRLGTTSRQGYLSGFLQSRSSKADGQAQKPEVKALFTYPIESCTGVGLPASETDGSGLKYDGAFTFAILHSEQPAPKGTSEPSTQWQHQWRTITAREHSRLDLLDMELWVPDPRQASLKRSNGHAKTISIEFILGVQKPRSRSRQGTLVMESAGQEAETPKKSSVPMVVSDQAANGGCLVIKFPFEPDFNLFGLYTQTVSIKVPLQPTVERVEFKGYTDEELVGDEETIRATNVTNEIDSAALDKLKYFLGLSKPLALFQKLAFEPARYTENTADASTDGKTRPRASDADFARMVNLATIREKQNGSNQSRAELERFRPNILIDGLPASEEAMWQRVVIGLCIPPRGPLPARGRGAVTGLSAKAEYLIDPASQDSEVGCLYASSEFDHGVIRVGDRVEVLQSEQKQF